VYVPTHRLLPVVGSWTVTAHLSPRLNTAI
jgi:hypothetical protein